jgi:hypothetical protein
MRDLTPSPGLARVCGDCGYVMLFLDERELEKVRAYIK